MNFFMKLTSTGAAKVAAAQAQSTTINLTHVAVGDGDGSPVGAPTGQENELVREVWRGSVADIYIEPGEPSVFKVESIIPSDDGEFFVREIGVFDEDGELFAYGNFPETYKPTVSEGATRDMVLVAAVRVSNANVVNLEIDTSVVIATRQWVLSVIAEAVGTLPSRSNLYFMGQN